jgi:hypothetical protein
LNSNSSQLINTKHLKALCILGLGLVSSYGYSNQTLEQFKGANLIKHDQSSQVDYALPLANLKKSARTWIPIKAKQVQGELSSSLFKFGRNESLLPIYDFYRKQMTASSNILYECSGRTCGSSNAWANNFFNDYRLYGADANQYLLVVDGATQGSGYQVLYLNRRGAGDVMLRLDSIEPEKNASKVNIAFKVNLDNKLALNQFINSQAKMKPYVFVITTASSLTPVESFIKGEKEIAEIKAELSDDALKHIQFVNLGNQAKPVYGESQVTVISNRDANKE